MGNCNACGAPLTPEGDCSGQVDDKASKGGLAAPSGIVLTTRDESIWRQATQAQLAKCRKLVEDVKEWGNMHRHLDSSYQMACDDILKALKGGV